MIYLLDKKGIRTVAPRVKLPPPPRLGLGFGLNHFEPIVWNLILPERKSKNSSEYLKSKFLNGNLSNAPALEFQEFVKLSFQTDFLEYN